jgi:hypothetical protein
MFIEQRPVDHKPRRAITRWLIVIVAYYAIVILKALVWAHRHGGFAAHNMHELIGITLRTSTIDVAILLALICVCLSNSFYRFNGVPRQGFSRFGPRVFSGAGRGRLRVWRGRTRAYARRSQSVSTSATL